MEEKMMTTFEPGDIILFQTQERNFKSNIGMILKHKENGNYVVLSVYNSTCMDVQSSWIVSIDRAQSVRNEITAHCEEKIMELQSQIRKVTQEEKESERVKKYDELKKQILATAKHMIECKDDNDFENKLKAIADMKRKIFSIELECASDIRKENGRIKGKIKEELLIRDSLLEHISNEKIENSFKFLC